MGALITRILLALGFSEGVAQKAGQIALLVGILSVLFAIFRFLKKVVTYPLALGAIVVALTLFPDTIGWIFIKIGEIELRVMALVLTAVMPDLFGTASGEFTSWAQIWSAGLSALPADMVDVMNSIGVAQILGMISSTISAVFMIKVYRRAMIRAGLM